MKLTINLDADLDQDYEPVLNLLALLNDGLNGKTEQEPLPKTVRRFPEKNTALEPDKPKQPETVAEVHALKGRPGAMFAQLKKEDLERRAKMAAQALLEQDFVDPYVEGNTVDAVAAIILPFFTNSSE